MIHYIHNNPFHHHYRDSYEKWPFSSYNAFLSNSPTKVRREDVLDWFGSKSAFVEIKIYDTSGRLVKLLEAEEKEPGKYSVVWRGKDNRGRVVASGVYFCRIKAGKFRQTRKIIYLR